MAHLADLSPEKRLLLERRLRERSAVPDASAGLARLPGYAGLARRPADATPVLTDAQWRLLVLDRANERLTSYNVAQAVRLRGALDVAALRRALDDLVRRHAVLRSRFLVRDGVGVVEVRSDARCDTTVAPLRPDAVDTFVHAAVTEYLDLAAGQLLRARIGVVAPDDHVLVLLTHHIVSDATSKLILFSELDELYAAHRDGREPRLGLVPFDYFDYAHWQAHREDAPAALDWWRDALAGVPEETALPTDRSRPTRPDFAGAKYGQRLSTDLVRGVDAFAQDRRATRFMVLLAGFTALLERYSGQGDIVVGSPTTGRHHDEFAEVVGFFLNTLPLRVDTSQDPTFGELVDRVRRTAAQAYRHQDVPFERIVDAAAPRRVLGRNPVFQSLFTLKGSPDAAPRLAGLDVELLPFEGGWTKVDLSVIASPTAEGGLGVLWQYATSLFDRGTIERLATQFARVLAEGLARPETRLSALHLAEPDEIETVARWNATDRTMSPALVHEVIAAQAARTPDRPAVHDAAGWITFAEFDRRADALADTLVASGVGPDSRVAIYLDRSTELAVAVLATLKAGGAYVPLDTGYPIERLEFMLADSGATVLVSHSALRERAPRHDRVIEVDTIGHADDGRAERRVRPTVTSDNLAYVLYTSGTTGRPKGVPITHCALGNQLVGVAELFGITAADTVLQKTPISFDIAGWEVLLAPMVGARLVMARPGGHLDPDYLIETIRLHGVTFVNFVPSMYDVFLDRAAARKCRSLRIVAVAGEALPAHTADASARVLPGAELWNMYGPTEAIAVTYERVVPGRTVTIGEPLVNCTIHVLDTELGQQPIGMPGEIYVGGAQLSPGYLNREELTAARFVDSPYGRVYRTGDRGVWHRDGRIQYLGRFDDQVKIRGFRVELGEVESVIALHPAVRSAAAVVVSTPAGASALAAYVTLHADRNGAGDADAAAGQRIVRQVYDTLRSRLPEHMIPATIRVLDDLPTGPTGKVDRRALAALPLVAAQQRPYVAPRTETERRLVKLWQDALGIARPISVDDSFFDLGGSSITALRLFPRLERRFRVKLALAMLFENVTVASLAATIDHERERREKWDLVVPLAEDGARTPLFLLPEVRGDVLAYRQLVRHLDADRPIYGLQFVGIDNRELPKFDIDEIAADCIATMKQVQPDGPYVLAGYCFGGVVAYAMAAQLRAAGEEIAFLGVIDGTPFGRTVPTDRPPQRPTLRERFTVRTAEQFRQKVKIVRMLAKERANYTVVKWCARIGARPPVFAQLHDVNVYATYNYVTPDADVRVVYFPAVPVGREAAIEVRRRRWEAIAGRGVETHKIYGERMSHFEIVRASYAPVLAEALNRCLIDVP